VYDADNSGSIDEGEFQKIYQAILSRLKARN
jgi:Ca2+-binding EF-hand superfamily protein